MYRLPPDRINFIIKRMTFAFERAILLKESPSRFVVNGSSYATIFNPSRWFFFLCVVFALTYSRCCVECIDFIFFSPFDLGIQQEHSVLDKQSAFSIRSGFHVENYMQSRGIKQRRNNQKKKHAAYNEVKSFAQDCIKLYAESVESERE